MDNIPSGTEYGRPKSQKRRKASTIPFVSAVDFYALSNEFISKWAPTVEAVDADASTALALGYSEIAYDPLKSAALQGVDDMQN
jgi:hypothetical protein